MGGKLWPIMHNTIVFSLVLMQVIALGVFTIKKSPVATGFTILLLVGTVLFNEYCRHRFSRIFEAYSAQVTNNSLALLAYETLLVSHKDTGVV